MMTIRSLELLREGKHWLCTLMSSPNMYGNCAIAFESVAAYVRGYSNAFWFLLGWQWKQVG